MPTVKYEPLSRFAVGWFGVRSISGRMGPPFPVSLALALERSAAYYCVVSLLCLRSSLDVQRQLLPSLKCQFLSTSLSKNCENEKVEEEGAMNGDVEVNGLCVAGFSFCRWVALDHR